MVENAEPKATPPPSPATVGSRDGVKLMQGFYLLFFGGLLSVVFALQMIIALSLPAFLTPFSSGSLLMMLAGAWRLRQVRALSREWTRATGWLLTATVLLVYLFPFVWAWRQAPRSLYFSCHAFAFLAMLILTMMALSVASAALARASGRLGLRRQMTLSLVSAAVLQLAPFCWLLFALLRQKHGEDAVLWLQSLVAAVPPFWMAIGLLPFALSLSLAWTAKDIALEQLVERKP